MALKACSCVSLVFLVALVPALHSQVAPAVEPSEGAPTQSSTLHPQFQNKDLGLDLPLHSAPKETVSVRFVVRHRSALNGQTVRIRGVIAAAILGDAACPSNRGMCMQSSIILADCKRGHHRLASSVRVLVPEDTDPRDYPIGGYSEVEVVVRGQKTSLELTKVHSSPP
jgi:hypothetical protein